MENLPTLPVTPRSIPDVPENVDFYMDHLNDPNFHFDELPSPGPSSRYSFELERKASRYYASSDTGTESRYGSDRYLVASGTESLRTSTAIDFDECVFCVCIL
jgi:hypothetical protein